MAMLVSITGIFTATVLHMHTCFIFTRDAKKVSSMPLSHVQVEKLVQEVVARVLPEGVKA